MKIYLVRHAQSEENALPLRGHTTPAEFNAVLQRSHVSPLTAQGQLQASAVVGKLAGAPIERLYTSPFARALATANVVGNTLGLTPEVIEDLREVLPRPIGEHRRSHSLGRLFIHGYLEMLLPWGDGETWRVAYHRAQRVWAQLASTPATEIVAVSHSALISLILFSLRRSPQWQITIRDISNGGVSIVEKRIGVS